MEEYNINNIQKINSINFINIGDNKIPERSKSPLYNLEQFNYQLKSHSFGVIQNRDKNSTKMGYNPNNSYKKNEDPSSYKNTEVGFIKINRNKIPHYHTKVMNKHKNESFEIKNKMNNKLFKKGLNNNDNDNFDQSYQQSMFNSLHNKSFNSHPLIKNNKGVYNTSLSYQKNNTDVNNDMILKNKNILYEKKINELRNQNQTLLNKLNAYIKDNKMKKNEINNLNLKNKNLLNELNKITMSKINRNENNNEIRNQNSYENQQINSKIYLPQNLMKSNEFYGSKKFMKENDNYNNNNNNDNLNKAQSESTKIMASSDAYNKAILEKKNNEIKILYQKNMKLSKDIELVTKKMGI